MNNYLIFRTPEEVAVYLAKNLIRKISETDTYITVGLSGGNTPKRIFSYWAKNFKEKIDWSKIHFFWGDDRMVPPESTESNYGEAQRLLFDKIPIPEENIHFINGMSDPECEALRYATEIDKFTNDKNNLPRIDINILGIGEDGHTASIFPGQEHLLTSTKYCGVAKHPISGQLRISLTGRILNNVKETYVLALGENKADMVKRFVEQTPDAKKYPAGNIRPFDGSLIFLVDEKAAKQLEE